MIPDSESPKYPEFEVKSKIGKLFTNEKILEKYSVRIYEIDPYFYEHHKEKIKVNKNRCECILFRIDVYFTEYFLAVETVEQNHESRDLIFEKKRQEALEKKLGCIFIRMSQKEVMIQTIELVKYKYLSVNLKKKKINELVPVPVDLSKLSIVVKNEVVIKTVYNKLDAKENNIDTSGFVLKTKYGADKTELEKKIPDTSKLVKKSDYDAKISEIESKIPSISGLATTSALTAIGNKIPSVSNLVKKTDYDTRINEIEKNLTDHKHDKYINTQEFNKLTAERFAARLAQANLITKTDFDAKLSSVNRKITSYKTKNLLIENKFKKIKNI